MDDLSCRIPVIRGTEHAIFLADMFQRIIAVILIEVRGHRAEGEFQEMGKIF